MSYIEQHATVTELISELEHAMRIENLRHELRTIFTGFITSKIFKQQEDSEKENHVFTYHFIDDFFNHLQEFNN